MGDDAATQARKVQHEIARNGQMKLDRLAALGADIKEVNFCGMRTFRTQEAAVEWGLLSSQTFVTHDFLDASDKRSIRTWLDGALTGEGFAKCAKFQYSVGGGDKCYSLSNLMATTEVRKGEYLVYFAQYGKHFCMKDSLALADRLWKEESDAFVFKQALSNLEKKVRTSLTRGKMRQSLRRARLSGELAALVEAAQEK